MLFSEILRATMTKHGLEIKDLAEATGISYGKIHSYVNGSIPKSKELNILCKELEIDIDDITFDELNISVTECSRTMGKAPNFVKAMVKKGVFGFFDGSSYHIPRKKFEQYMGLVEDNHIDLEKLVTALTYALDIATKKADSSQKSAQ